MASIICDTGNMLIDIESGSHVGYVTDIASGGEQSPKIHFIRR